MTVLIPDNALQYYEDALDQNQKKYLRATSIRFCLENIFDTVFLHICGINEVGKVKEKWKSATLNQKIDMLTDYFPEDILSRVKGIKDLGNSGAHTQSHMLITEEDIKLSLIDLSLICEWTITAYFQKYGFNVHPWLPTILSTLPPSNRIRILESTLFRTLEVLNISDKTALKSYQSILARKQNAADQGEIWTLFEIDKQFSMSDNGDYQTFDQLHLLIDKLAMAYLKNGQFDKSTSFIQDCFSRELISQNYKCCMLKKLEKMQPSLDQFNIPMSLNDTRDAFQKLLSVVKEEERSLFITIFTSFLAQKVS
ncbi:hypothetical protein SDC64_01880 [Acinetobacter haemolyticus]|uniref:hypothetical protein n=1 Tax=Acinetobacter haemolyticus TaxID=29430 RepID=UPI002A6B0760|nr:hypothetical protein [Acinetobacter haemolyticus]WPO67715.1 hypothetical protein SDC64_01880 [Acinetobacter haemolyticus]